MKNTNKTNTNLVAHKSIKLRFNDLPQIRDQVKPDIDKVQTRLPEVIEYRGYQGNYGWIEDHSFFYGIAVDSEKQHSLVFEGTDDEEVIMNFKEIVDEYFDVA